MPPETEGRKLSVKQKRPELAQCIYEALFISPHSRRYFFLLLQEPKSSSSLSHSPPSLSQRRPPKSSSRRSSTYRHGSARDFFSDTLSVLLFPLHLLPKRSFISKRPLNLPISSKNKENEPDLGSDSDNAQLVAFLNPNSLSPLSNDSAMGLVLSAAVGRGWSTGSGMEGPPAPEPGSDSSDRPGSTFPWSLFTKSPRRRMRVAFTCNVCGQRTTRAINPHGYTDGTVFVQCCGCNVFHKLVDNLNLFHEMKCYVSPSFWGKGDVRFNFFDGKDDDDSGNMFPIL